MVVVARTLPVLGSSRSNRAPVASLTQIAPAAPAMPHGLPPTCALSTTRLCGPAVVGDGAGVVAGAGVGVGAETGRAGWPPHAVSNAVPATRTPNFSGLTTATCRRYGGIAVTSP